jgi:hypothetical protein
MSFFDFFRSPGAQPSSVSEADEQAVARYRYLLRTAPPEAIEQAHAEAFAQLTPEQRRRILEELAADMPDAERNGAWRTGDAPGALARVATRAELREPGAMERAWSRMGAAPGAAPGLGSMFAGSLLASMAGSVLGTMIAQHFFTSQPEASHLFGGSPGDSASGGSLADDPWQRLDSQDVGNAQDASDDFSDLDGGMDGGSFDV